MGSTAECRGQRKVDRKLSEQHRENKLKEKLLSMTLRAFGTITKDIAFMQSYCRDSRAPKKLELKSIFKKWLKYPPSL